MPDLYTLDLDGDPVPCDNLAAWAALIAGTRQVARTQVAGGVVSTIFLGYAPAHCPALMFETMTFGVPGLDGEQDRYATLAEAQAGHRRAVAAAQAQLDAARAGQPAPR